MMKERLEEIACVVVPAAICKYFKWKNREMTKKRSSEMLGDEMENGRLEMVNDFKKGRREF